MTQIGGNPPGGARPTSTPPPTTGGPTGASTTTTPETVTTEATTPAAPVTTPTVDTDRFVSGGPTLGTDRSPVDRRMDTALQGFQSKIEEALHHDALSMARGQTPWRNGDSLSDTQKKALGDAATDFVKEVPLGALAPGVAADVSRALSARGIHVENIEQKSLSEIGKVAGDIAGDKAKELANSLKENAPIAYYGLLGGAAVAVGAYGYSKGSGALEKLGIKPEIKTGFFDDAVTARVRAAWEPGFKNPTFGGVVRANLDVTSRVNVSAEANFDANRFVDMRLASTVKLSNFEHFTLDAGVNDRGRLSSVGGRYEMLNDGRGLTISAGGRYDVATERGAADVMLRYQPNQNFDFALSGQTDFRGNSQVGVGVRWRF